jgi:hypothetical protein
MISGLALALFFPPSFIHADRLDQTRLFLPYLYAGIYGAGGGTYMTGLWTLLGSYNPVASFAGKLVFRFSGFIFFFSCFCFAVFVCSLEAISRLVNNFFSSLTIASFIWVNAWIGNFKISIIILLMLIVVCLLIFCVLKLLELRRMDDYDIVSGLSSQSFF